MQDLLEAVQPSWAVICCSEEEPTEDKTLELLAEEGVSVWDTSEQAVVTGCDGSKISVWEE